MAVPIVKPRDFLERLRAYLNTIGDGERRIVAIAGAPASGKSSLAHHILQALNADDPGSTAVVEMDGFHYDDEYLEQHGWRPRKGAPHTFDVDGLASTLKRLRRNNEEGVMIPRFDRRIEIARAGAIRVPRSVRLIVVEGNYLLLDNPPWDRLRDRFDLTALVKVGEPVLVERLRKRWRDLSLDEAAVQSKLEENDLPNGRVVYGASREPDMIINGEAGIH